MSTAATRPSLCPACDQPIDIGDLVIPLGDVVVHLDCPPAP